MPDPPLSSGPGDSAGTEPGHGSPPRAPRWVKVFAIIVAALVLLAVVVKLTGLGGSDHGPGRHTSDSDVPPASVTDVPTLSGEGGGGHVPPEGGHG